MVINMISFFNYGRLQDYGKQMEAKSLWNRRKQNGFYDNLKESDPQKAAIQEQADRMHLQQDSSALENIKSKLQRGESLSAAEKEALRNSDPELYKKAEEMEQERSAYEKKLKACRTRDEVQNLKIEKLNASLVTIGNVENNPNIPEAKKLEVAQGEAMRLAAVNRAEAAFIRSGEYDKLPTQNEINLEEAKENQENKEAEEEIKPEEPQPAEPQPHIQEPGQAENTELKPGAEPSTPKSEVRTEAPSKQAEKSTARLQASSRQEEKVKRPARQRQKAVDSYVMLSGKLK